MNAHCLCGAVEVGIDAAPDHINDCNCTLCRKVGAAWGYFSSASVAVDGETTTITRSDVEEPCVELHRCATCGCITHFTLSSSFQTQNPDADQVGVNMRLFAPDELVGVEVRFPDGLAWNGQSDFGYRRPALVLDAETRW